MLLIFQVNKYIERKRKCGNHSDTPAASVNGIKITEMQISFISIEIIIAQHKQKKTLRIHKDDSLFMNKILWHTNAFKQRCSGIYEDSLPVSGSH